MICEGEGMVAADSAAPGTTNNAAYLRALVDYSVT